MIEFSAKTQFLKTHTETELVELRKLLENPILKEAMIFTMASLADKISGGTGPAEHALILYGAREFRQNLLNLPEPELEYKEPPQKQRQPVPTPDGR